MQPADTVVSVEEYLNSSYEGGDRDYIDGCLIERNAGDLDHSLAQGCLLWAFRNRRNDWKTYAFSELRIQISPTWFLVPDVCVCLDQRPSDSILKTPPFLAIEILSKGDTASDLLEKVSLYLNFGVPFAWVIDPRRKRAVIHTSVAAYEAKTGILWTKDPRFELTLDSILSDG